MSLLDDLEYRDNSLLADIERTAASTALTFGSHAIKGATLGLIDPTKRVAEYLGEDIYGAAPGWARAGAEMAGSFIPVTGALGGARMLVPGATIMPRFLQGMIAGGGIGAARGLFVGEDLGEIARGSLLEGLVFGTLEGLTGIPAFVKKRSLLSRGVKGVEDIAPYEVGIPDVAITPADATAMQEAEAIVHRTSPTPRTMARMLRGPLPQAQLVDQQLLKQAIAGGLFRDEYGLYGKEIMLQIKGRSSIDLHDGYIMGLTPDKKAVMYKSLTTGDQMQIPIRKFLSDKGTPGARFFWGTNATHAVEPNWAAEYSLAKSNWKYFTNKLLKKGQISDDQYDAFLKFANPKAKTISDLSLSEVRMLTVMMQRGAEAAPGEIVLPQKLHDVVGFMGTEAGMARLGALAHFQPARYVIEALTRKSGGAKWVGNLFNRFIEGMNERKVLRWFIHERFNTKTGLLKGLDNDQMAWLYDISEAIREKTVGMGLGTPEFKVARNEVINEWYNTAKTKWGPSTALQLRKAYRRIRIMFDEFHANLSKAGHLEKYRFKKEYWPLLAAEEKFLLDLYPNAPEVAKQFMQYVRKDIMKNPEKNILKLIDAYVGAYSRLMHIKPAIDAMNREFRVRKISPDVKKWFRHYSARLYGLPSEVDFRLAESLKSIGRNPITSRVPILGTYFKHFTTRDFIKVSMFFNDLPYMAHLGLRPFSAMRNLLQPMITTGPTIGNRWLARGYYEAATNAEGLQWVRQNRLLQESLGEYDLRISLSPKRLDKFGQFMMAMFRKTDEINRYASGLGFRAKFDHFWNKIMDVASPKTTEEFFTKIKLRRFRPTVREEVRGLARAWREAEEMRRYRYPKDSPRAKEIRENLKRIIGKPWEHPDSIRERMRVRLTGEAIGDTQWLYGKEHAPIFTHSWGAIGKQMGVYQTWWLNYAQLMKRLLFHYPKSGDWAPMGVWAANNLAIGMAMVGLGWSAGKVIRTIGAGPFPTELPLDPPGIQPFRHMAQAFGNIVFRGDSEKAEDNMKTALRRAWDNWVPGSLVYKELAKTSPALTLRVKGTLLTPLPSLRHAPMHEKMAAVLGGWGQQK